MLFEYRFIARLPKDDFLPAQTEYDISKRSKLGRVSTFFFFLLMYFYIGRKAYCTVLNFVRRH